jgi:S-DNA-T family DNA segregation ATPase FtsK/SpoIIIE
MAEAATVRRASAAPRGSHGRAPPRSRWARLGDAGGRAWRSVFALRLRGGAGALAGAALIASFATYRAADPSLDVASGDRPHNALGLVGAAAADLGLQTLGLGAWIAALMLVVWGLNRACASDPRLNRHDLAVRALAGGLGALLLAGVLALPQPPADWPLARGLGGVFGDALLTAAGHLAALAHAPHPTLVGGAVLALCAIPALAFGAGLRAHDLVEGVRSLRPVARPKPQRSLEFAPDPEPAVARPPRRPATTTTTTRPSRSTAPWPSSTPADPRSPACASPPPSLRCASSANARRASTSATRRRSGCPSSTC